MESQVNGGPASSGECALQVSVLPNLLCTSEEPGLAYVSLEDSSAVVRIPPARFRIRRC